jgi:predicted oxidoreductase
VNQQRKQEGKRRTKDNKKKKITQITRLRMCSKKRSSRFIPAQFITKIKQPEAGRRFLEQIKVLMKKKKTELNTTLLICKVVKKKKTFSGSRVLSSL